MKRNSLVFGVMIVAVLFFTPHNVGAQCPQDTVDLGICDTLYVETFDCDHEYQAQPGSFDSVRVAIYVTHDSNTFWWEGGGKWIQDSICAFVIPLTFWHQPPGCADSVFLPNWDNWNNTATNPYDPRMNRSIFRDIVDSHTGDTVYNRMLDIANDYNAWDNLIVDIDPYSDDGDSGHAWMAFIASGADIKWWEGSKVLLATLTFHVYMSEDCDTTEIGIDSTFWPPTAQLEFVRYDAETYVPRHFLPVKDTIYLPINQPPELTCPDHETQHTNGTFTTTTKWYASDPDSDLVMPPTCQAPGGPIPTCSVNVDSSTGAFAEGTITYSVTDHGQVGTYYITLTVMDDQEMADTCFLPITLDNHPPMLSAIGNHKFNEGDYIVLNVSAFDLDDDSLIFTASNLPEGAYFSGENGVFLWTPTYTEYGTYPDIHFEITDDQGAVDYEDIEIEILNYPQGDVTGDGKANISDVVYLINYLFLIGSPVPDPLEAGDVNCDGLVNVADALHLINYLFIDGPAPCAPPSPRFVLPKSNGLVNGLVWVAVENLSDTPVQAVEFEYSADSAVWNELVFDTTRPPPMIVDKTGRTYQGSWNTDTLASGQYWLRVTMTDSVHNVEDSETIPVRIDKNPTPVITATYDSSTGTVTFDASSSYDPEGSVIGWEWIFCDGSTYQASVVEKDFVPGDSCQVNLTVYDDVFNSSTSYNMLVVYYDTISFGRLEYCICISLSVHDSGKIPAGSGLNFSNTNAPNPQGGRALGPIDHHEQAGDPPENIPMGEISLYFMVEAIVIGNPECCSTMQYNNMTILYDGPGGPGPNGMKVLHGPNGAPFDPDSPDDPKKPPDAPSELGPDDYTTDCNCRRDRPAGDGVVLEKRPLTTVPTARFLPFAFGVIRWIDAPGDPTVTGRDFLWNGYRIFDFKKFQVVDYFFGSCSGGCKKCIVWKAWYDWHGMRRDVTGDGEPDPPTITDPDAPCP